MKRFLLKLVLFGVTALLLLNLVTALFGPFFVREGSDAFAAIALAETPSPQTEAVFGDSVSRQLLRHAQMPGVLNLTSNQAVSVCGQYLLIRLAIEHHPSLQRVTLVYHPSCFGNDLDGLYTFNYFARPFYLRPLFQGQIDSVITTRMEQRPVTRLVVLPMFRYTDLLGSTQFPDPARRTYISPVTADYLRQTADFCATRHVRLRILPDPVSTSFGFDPQVFLREVTAAHLDDLLAGYPSRIRYVDPSELGDNLHFKMPYVREAMAPLVKMLLEPDRPDQAKVREAEPGLKR